MLKGLYKYAYTHTYMRFYKIYILHRNAELDKENEVLRSQIEKLKKTLDGVRMQDAKRFI